MNLLEIMEEDQENKIYKKKISLIIHCAAQPSHDYGKKFPILDFNVNATGTLNLLELTKRYCPDSPFIFMSTNKVYGDNPNKLKIIEKSNHFHWSAGERKISFGESSSNMQG